MSRIRLHSTCFTVVFLSITAFFFAGCSSTQNITLRSDGSGSGDIHVKLDSLVMDYAGDLAGGFGNGGGPTRLFDTSAITARIRSLPVVHLESIGSEEPDTLDITVAFETIDQLFLSQEKVPESAVFRFSEKNGIKTLKFNLTAQNFPLVTSVLGLEGNEITDTFGPQEGSPFSVNEYYEMMEYLFDEYAAKEEIDAVLDASVVSITFNLSGNVVKVEGSSGIETSYDGTKVKITIPVVQILTLENPVSCSISWK